MASNRRYLLLRYGNVLGVIELQCACKICFNVFIHQNDDAVRADITAVYRDLGDGHNGILLNFITTYSPPYAVSSVI